MPKASDKLGMIYQNLIDAGCSTEMTDTCMEYVREGKITDILPLLSRHRESLLQTVRQGKQKIDCLDFLIYRIKKDSVESRS